MADEITLAKRYARALLDVTLASGEFAAVEHDLYAVADAYDASAELRTFLGSPSFDRGRKKSALKAIFEGKVKPVTLRFLELLVDKRRIGHIRKIAVAFDDLNDEATGTAKATVRSFMPLSDAHREALVSKIRTMTGRPNIRLVEKTDPRLLGGLVVRIGDSVLDGSLLGRLKRLTDHLLVPEDERSARAAGMAAEAIAAEG